MFAGADIHVMQDFADRIILLIVGCQRDEKNQQGTVGGYACKDRFHIFFGSP